MRSRIQSENDVAAIQLSGGKQIQRGGQHSYPGGNRSRSQVEWQAELCRGSVNSQNRENPAHHTEDQRQSQNRPAIARRNSQLLGMEQRHNEDWHGDNKSCNRPRNADVEKVFAAVDRRPQTDHSAQRPEQRRKRNEVGQRGLYAATTAYNVVAKFVGSQNSQ